MRRTLSRRFSCPHQGDRGGKNPGDVTTSIRRLLYRGRQGARKKKKQVPNGNRTKSTEHRDTSTLSISRVSSDPCTEKKIVRIGGKTTTNGDKGDRGLSSDPSPQSGLHNSHVHPNAVSWKPKAYCKRDASRAKNERRLSPRDIIGRGSGF